MASVVSAAGALFCWSHIPEKLAASKINHRVSEVGYDENAP